MRPRDENANRFLDSTEYRSTAPQRAQLTHAISIHATSKPLRRLLHLLLLVLLRDLGGLLL